MAEMVDPELVAQVARGVVARVAPAELPLFRSVSSAYFADPDAGPASRRGKDEMLGFGLGDALTQLTPSVLMVTQAVLAYLVNTLMSSAKDASSALVSDWVKRLFKPLGPEEAPKAAAAALTREQLARVREVALAKAKQLRLSDAQAELIADAMIGGLALAPLS